MTGPCIRFPALRRLVHDKKTKVRDTPCAEEIDPAADGRCGISAEKLRLFKVIIGLSDLFGLLLKPGDGRIPGNSVCIDAFPRLCGVSIFIAQMNAGSARAVGRF